MIQVSTRSDAGVHPLGRRERVRVETTSEIKEHALVLMNTHGVHAMSLRAVARAMGMAPSALYRYFAGRDDLLTAMIVDGFNSLAEDLERTYAEQHTQSPTPPATEVFVAVAATYRRWALDHATQFALIFSDPVPGYRGTADPTAALVRGTTLLLRIMADLVEEGGVDLDRIGGELSPDLYGRLDAWSQVDSWHLPPAALAAALRCYASLHGLISLDMTEKLPPFVHHDEDLFTSTMRDVISGLAK